MMANRAWEWWTRVNARFGSFFLFFCIVASTFASVGVYVQSRTNAAQDATRAADQKQRTIANSKLLDCIKEYTKDLSESLPAVREASQIRNQALANVLIGDDEHLGLGLLIYRAQQGVKSDPKKDLADLARTFLEFQKADQHLLKVQKDNPYPSAPSLDCELS